MTPGEEKDVPSSLPGGSTYIIFGWFATAFEVLEGAWRGQVHEMLSCVPCFYLQLCKVDHSRLIQMTAPVYAHEANGTQRITILDIFTF